MSRQTPNLESSPDCSSNCNNAADSSPASGSESFKTSSNGSQDVRLNNSVSLSFCSSNSVSSEANLEKSRSFDANEANFKRVFSPSKPHKGNDLRWDAIQSVKCSKNEDLGLGHFRLLKKLGCGDIGSVYLAELREMGCFFAMKVMDKGMLIGRKKLVRAQTEREILGLLDHPFLPTLYSHFETEKFSCLLMEFCSGGDLHILRQKQPGKHFSEQAARFYASEVLLALEYLHMMGVVYRDLKPENVMVREDGHIMLSDFDLSLQSFVSPTLIQSTSQPSCHIASYCIQPSCIVDSSCKLPVACIQPSCFKPRFLNNNKPRKAKTEKGGSDSLPMLIAEPTDARSMSFVGTHEYLAPEIIRGDGHGSSVDWWTFGIFLYELLTGKTPFKGNGNRETLFNVVGQPLKFPDGSISFAAKDLIRGLLAKDPKKRLGFKKGATEIKQHPFFDNVNWALIRSTNPPEIPKPIDLSILNETLKSSSVQQQDKHSKQSDSSSGPYLDFEFF
ncbi:hypothetical protein EUTSA_v10027731mg [Eutrema salsugineum]|uniref:non-specific serine/threonine protein kinase n=1 Tax=Eutrema salsugineum TaxID=72664 RepID=V4M455_EUTSA|nr:serine/threonine-protein kinase D6PK [Eutrema salsugineum]ESQ47013.1 hypothetical protein EUTSA_v10027731mg [Eutrema salsugineum]